MENQKLKSLFVQAILISCSMFMSCKRQVEEVIRDFECFQISVPVSWKSLKIKGIDSNVNAILTPNGDTIYIECGISANPFNDFVPIRSMQRKAEYDAAGFKIPADIVFSENPEIDEAQGIYLKQYYYYDRVGGLKAKLGFPKKVGNGLCLIHFPRIDSAGSKISIYVSNVDSLTQMQIYKSFTSIKLKKFNNLF